MDFDKMLKNFKQKDSEDDTECVLKACDYFSKVEDPNQIMDFCRASLLIYKAYFEGISRKDICAKLIEKGFPDNIGLVLKSKLENLEKLQNLSEEEFLLLDILFLILVNLTEESGAFCEKASKSLQGALEKIMDSRQYLVQHIEDVRCLGIVYDAVSVAMNMLKHSDKGYGNAESLRAVRKAASKLQDPDKRELQFICNCCLVFLGSVSDDTCGVDTMAFLWSSLEKSDSSTESHNFMTAKELLRVLEKMCGKESVAKQVAHAKELDMLHRISTDHNVEVRNVVSKMVGHPGVKELVKADNVGEQLLAPLTYKWDIFLSYCHNDRSNMKKIYDGLRERGYKVWLDDVEMKGGRVDDAMIEGIDNSEVFLMAVSSGYEKSKNCRKEFDYAERKEKIVVIVIVEEKYKMDDWIEFHLSNALYTRMGKKSLEELLDDVIEAMKKPRS